MRYFFDIQGERNDIRDEEGLELDNEQQAHREARRLLAQIAEDESRFCATAVLMAKVRDQAGRPIYQAMLTLEGARVQ